MYKKYFLSNLKRFYEVQSHLIIFSTSPRSLFVPSRLSQKCSAFTDNFIILHSLLQNYSFYSFKFIHFGRKVPSVINHHTDVHKNGTGIGDTGIFLGICAERIKTVEF